MVHKKIFLRQRQRVESVCQQSHKGAQELGSNIGDDGEDEENIAIQNIATEKGNEPKLRNRMMKFDGVWFATFKELFYCFMETMDDWKL
jgi:hypothetical protein